MMMVAMMMVPAPENFRNKVQASQCHEVGASECGHQL